MYFHFLFKTWTHIKHKSGLSKTLVSPIIHGKLCHYPGALNQVDKQKDQSSQLLNTLGSNSAFTRMFFQHACVLGLHHGYTKISVPSSSLVHLLLDHLFYTSSVEFTFLQMLLFLQTMISQYCKLGSIWNLLSVLSPGAEQS